MAALIQLCQVYDKSIILRKIEKHLVLNIYLEMIEDTWFCFGNEVITFVNLWNWLLLNS